MTDHRQLRIADARLKQSTTEIKDLRGRLEATEERYRKLQYRLERMPWFINRHDIKRKDLPDLADLHELLNEYGHLVNAAHPLPPISEGPRSAETPQPGSATRWARSARHSIDRDIRILTNRIQRLLQTPAEERVQPGPGEECGLCGKTKRHTRTWKKK